MLQHDNARPHAVRQRHTVPCQQQRPKFSSGLRCPQTQIPTNTLGTSRGDVFEAEWTPLLMYVSCFRHSSRSGWPSRRKWFTTWSSPCPRVAGQLLILEEDSPLLMSLSRKIPSDWTFSLTRRMLKSWSLTWINRKMKYDALEFLLSFRTSKCKTNKICVFSF